MVKIRQADINKQCEIDYIASGNVSSLLLTGDRLTKVLEIASSLQSLSVIESYSNNNAINDGRTNSKDVKYL